MKTIDEQLNIINDTKEGIANVLNSKGVEVTEDTKFADYPDKVAMLMGAGEVQAEVDRNVAEVTEQYRQDLADVSEEVNGLKTTKADKSYVDEQLAGKLDASVAAETYQPKGAYLTEHQDISGKLDASVAAETYQPKGAYLTEHQSLDAYATKEYVGQQGFLTQHQDISGKLDASVAAETYQPKGAYLTEHQDISGKLDASVAAETYQPKGNYLTEHQSLDAYATKEYVGEQGFLTQHQDISGKLDASVAAETYQPKGNYLTEHQSLADYATKSEIPDVSNLLDASVAASTYATKSEVGGYEVVTVHGNEKGSNSQSGYVIKANKVVIDYNSETAISTGQYFDAQDGHNNRIVANMNKFLANYSMVTGYNNGTTVNGTCTACTANEDLTQVHLEYTLDEAVTMTFDGAYSAKVFVEKGDAVTVQFIYEVGALGLIAGNMGEKLDASVAAATYQPKGTYLTEHQDISGKLDASVAAETYQPKGSYLTEHQDISGKLDASVAAETYQPKGSYLTEHQDISGKLDASVAEATYQPKGNYLTEHQSLANYATKADIDGGNHYAFNFDGQTPSVSLVGNTVKFTEVRFTWEDVNGNAQSSINSGVNPVHINFSNGKSLIGSTSNFTVGTSSMNLTCDGQTAEVVSYSWDGSVLTQVSRFANAIEGTVSANGCGNFGAMHCSGSLDFPMTWKQYVDTNFLTEEQNIDHKLDASVAESTYALKADTIYSEGDVSTNHGATDDLSTTPVTFTCDKMKFTCEGGWEGMAATSEKSVGLTITCDEGTVKLIKLDGVFTLTTAYSWNNVTAANTITTVKASNFTYNLNEITFNDKVTFTNVTAVTVSNFGSNVQMTTSEHVVTTVKQKIAALEALIAGYHPANNNPE